MATAEKKPTFEEQLNQLDGIISGLEKGSMPLDKMIEQYKKGIELSRSLRSMLDSARDQLSQVELDDGEYIDSADGNDDDA